MKIVIERSSFANALAKVKDSAGNQTMPITENVKIETVDDENVRLTATNLDTTISTTVRCQVREPGATTAPIKLLVQMVNVLTAGIVEFSCDDRTNGKAKLVGGDTKYSLATMPVAEFPVPASVEGGMFKIGQDTLRSLIARTAYAVSDDKTRPTFMGVNLFTNDGFVYSVASDGRRFAIARAKYDGDASFNIIIPNGTLKLLRSVLGSDGEVSVRCSDRVAARFETDTLTLQTKLIDDEFPKVIDRMPRITEKTVEIDRTEFTDAIRQASVTSVSITAQRVAITVRSGVIRLVSTDNEISDSEIIVPAKYDGDECTFRMNPKYLLDALTSFSDDTVLLRFENAAKPIEFTVGDDSTYAQVAPLRV